MADTTGMADAAGNADLPEPLVARPESIEWKESASGVRMAVLLGDPKEAGPFVLRLEYPAGFVKEPHFHPGDAHITVRAGAYFRGYGTVFDKAPGIELIPGTFSVNPARVPHYEWAEEPASIEVHAMGPWATVYVEAAGQPMEMPAKVAAEITM